MPGNLAGQRHEARQTVDELRRHLGLFSYQQDGPTAESGPQGGLSHQLGVRPGGIVELLVEREGAGAVTLALQIMVQSSGGRGVWAIVDPALECYIAALSGWGIQPARTLILRPGSLQETCWAIEQCLRCPGVRATLAWLDKRLSARVHRRWQLAAEVGGGVGLFFRPVWARREAIWADSRLLVTPIAGGQGESRRIEIEVLYRRGGWGGSGQAWEIDHATGHVRLVSPMANPATEAREARA
jgi:cell division inhibitor SulA